ncbi:hypothetical protein RD055328_08360 [Companilactobacillus sp. RD055328]|uniref:hypothetical protein n=1 Tax=Companilactobacillus sp. RD055328 TaxID=2916634 RepID=UPI001FC88240|nr:hypothetical protein [Companilactobacillus sp. RD055328]GKQ42913.1 hypothetical protein RD055328_08360 [Companilactobacillus sp. RD055328]
MQSPEQQLFDYFYKFGLESNYDVYDHLPMQEESATYPFVTVGETQIISGGTKYSLNGYVAITIHFWGNDTQRLTISDMVNRFFYAGIHLKNLKNYNVVIDKQAITQRVLQDTSVPNTTLWHGILDIQFKIL